MGVFVAWKALREFYTWKTSVLGKLISTEFVWFVLFEVAGRLWIVCGVIMFCSSNFHVAHSLSYVGFSAGTVAFVNNMGETMRNVEVRTSEHNDPVANLLKINKKLIMNIENVSHLPKLSIWFDKSVFWANLWENCKNGF